MIPAQTPTEAANCQRCPLSEHRQQVVWGEGPDDADLMLLFEAPGREEDLKGRPLMGAAGKKLAQLLDEVGLRREELYIANVVKCRPPENRLDRYPVAIVECEPWLWQELEDVKPKVLVCMGGTAGGAWFPGMSVRSTCGLARQTWSPVGDREPLVVIGSAHPAALFREGNEWARDGILTAFRRAKEFL